MTGIKEVEILDYKATCRGDEEMIFISTDPKGKAYHELIDLAFQYCDEFILVIRKDMDVSKNAKTVLHRLSSSLKEIKDQFEWPGTRYFGEEPASVYYFKTDKNANNILKEVSNSLHSWVQPILPEDLSFRKGKEVWLMNTSHEAESYILTENRNEIDRILSIRNLELKL